LILFPETAPLPFPALISEPCGQDATTTKSVRSKN
jgi:hypothetical protein